MQQMTDTDLSDAVEIIKGRLYWVALHGGRPGGSNAHYFSIDTELIYEPFFADFGPLNLAMTYRYICMLQKKLEDPTLKSKTIIHYCSRDPKKRANAAYLICAYQVVILRKSAEQAFASFRDIYPPFLPFRDATTCASSFPLTVQDCVKGLQTAIELGWFDFKTFNAEAYEFFEKVENGDMSWIVPNKFLAFAGPSPTPTDADGFPAFTPEDYVPTFQQDGIGLVFRLNKKQYDRQRFIDHGIRHVDLYFPDGSCPPQDIIDKFLHIVENEPGAVAIHCKAGLGRTGTLIGLYCMKHFGWSGRAFIGWNRICRPGSILGPQQQFLCDMEATMRALGEQSMLSQQMSRLSLSSQQQKEDVGQGDRLVGAKRGLGSPAATSPKSPGVAHSYNQRAMISLKGMFGNSNHK